MKISKKLVSFMLALAMVVTAMAVQTVPVQAKTKAKVKAVKVTNVKGNKVTIYQGDNLTLKTNYKASQLKFKTSDKKVATVSDKGVITAVKKGTAKVTVSLKKNAKVKKVVNINVSDKYIVTNSKSGGNTVKEMYNPKTNKSTYKVTSKGMDTLHKVKMDVSFEFTTDERYMQGTGCTGEISNYANPDRKYVVSLMVHDNTDKLINKYKDMTDQEWFTNFYTMSENELSHSKIEKNEDSKYFRVLLTTPNDGSDKVDSLLVIVDKQKQKIYSFIYIDRDKEINNDRDYNVVKSIKLVK